VFVLTSSSVCALPSARLVTVCRTKSCRRYGAELQWLGVGDVICRRCVSRAILSEKVRTVRSAGRAQPFINESQQSRRRQTHNRQFIWINSVLIYSLSPLPDLPTSHYHLGYSLAQLPYCMQHGGRCVVLSLIVLWCRSIEPPVSCYCYESSLARTRATCSAPAPLGRCPNVTHDVVDHVNIEVEVSISADTLLVWNFNFLRSIQRVHQKRTWQKLKYSKCEISTVFIFFEDCCDIYSKLCSSRFYYLSR